MIEQGVHVPNGVVGTEYGYQRVGTLENHQELLTHVGVVHAGVGLDSFGNQGQ